MKEWGGGLLGVFVLYDALSRPLIVRSHSGPALVGAFQSICHRHCHCHRSRRNGHHHHGHNRHHHHQRQNEFEFDLYVLSFFHVGSI